MAVSMNAFALQSNNILSIGHDGGEPGRGMSSRWEIPNEVLFLRVRKIHDHVFEDIREPWFYRERLFRVSNTHPVGRVSARVLLN